MKEGQLPSISSLDLRSSQPAQSEEWTMVHQKPRPDSRIDYATDPVSLITNRDTGDEAPEVQSSTIPAPGEQRRKMIDQAGATVFDFAHPFHSMRVAFEARRATRKGTRM